MGIFALDVADFAVSVVSESSGVVEGEAPAGLQAPREVGCHGGDAPRELQALGSSRGEGSALFQQQVFSADMQPKSGALTAQQVSGRLDFPRGVAWVEGS